MTRTSETGSIYLGVAGGLLAVSGLLAGAYVVLGGDAQARTVAGAGPAIGDPGELAAQVEGALGDEVQVVIAGSTVRLRWSDLGVVVDDTEIDRAARRAAADEPLGALRAAGALPVRVDRDAAVAALTALKGRHDRAAVDARLDLEARLVRAEEAGFGIDVFASLPRLESAARQGAARIELAGVALPATVTRESLGIDDISHVLGHWETKFAVADKDRNFNLKLAASKVNGHVIPPGETFSFNGVVGERTEQQGYKIAGVIQAGEMVDGLAGGACQISTTLYGAAFFAGLDIVKTRPHSRPSVYTPWGFDATVNWPSVDLAFRNPYDFPVALRYVVAGGNAKVEVLGRKRPYDKIVFEREVLESTPFASEERLDPTLPEGATLIDQEGYDGYQFIRYRKFFRGGKQVKVEKQKLEYRPVTEYIRRGTNPDPSLKEPKQPKLKSPRPPRNGTGAIVQ
jgi:vancomycin resistance protein YoaR